jgi:magnesium transporter
MNVWTFTDSDVREGGLDAFQDWHASPVGKVCVFAGEEDTASLKGVLQALNVHPLAIQDVLRDRHPPKYEVFPEYRVFLMRVLPHQGKSFFLHPVQVSLVVGENWLVCRYQHKCLSVDAILASMRLKAELSGVAVLTWEIMETVASHYLDWLMYLERRIGTLEDALLMASDDKLLMDVIALKTGLRKYRRNFLYLERVAGQVRDKGIGPDILAYSPECNDLYEKWERVYSMSAMFYEQLGDMIDGYISQSSYKLNVTMRVLTVITAIFIPLSFIAALYGMNFINMPELRYHNGYFVLLAVMLFVGLGMVIWFRKIKWL